MNRILVIVLSVLPLLAQAEIYRWVDKNGVVNFSNERPDDLEQKQSRQPLANIFVSPTIGAVKRPERSGQRVILYSAGRCKACDEARKYFQENKIAFLEYDIEKSDENRRAFESLDGLSVPLIVIGGKPLNGFSIKSFRAAYE